MTAISLFPLRFWIAAGSDSDWPTKGFELADLNASGRTFNPDAR
jgi:hypothetical protein